MNAKDMSAMQKTMKSMYKKMDEMYKKMLEMTDPVEKKKMQTEIDNMKDKMESEMDKMVVSKEHRSFNEIERRTNTVELRVISSDATKQPVIKGYGAKFRTLSEPMPIMRDGEKVGTFREQLMPGCFASAIPTSDTRSLFNHDPNLILGRTTSGTMRIAEDEVGLNFEVDPPDTTYANNLQVSMRRGDITQCSFGFSVAEGGDSFAKDSMPGCWIRSIHKIAKLYDVSPVTYPAYVDTNCAMRSALSAVATEEAEIERRVAEQLEAEKRTAEKEEADAAELLVEEQRKAAELAEQEEANKVAEEQRTAEIENELLLNELALIELEAV